MITPIAELITPSDDGAFHCAACQWRCVLRPGETGKCLVRVATDDGIALLNHGLISGAAIGPVEDHRLWHFFPDSLVLSIGSWGYATTADQGRGPYTNIPDDLAKRRVRVAVRRLQLLDGYAGSIGDVLPIFASRRGRNARRIKIRFRKSFENSDDFVRFSRRNADDIRFGRRHIRAKLRVQIPKIFNRRVRSLR